MSKFSRRFVLVIKKKKKRNFDTSCVDVLLHTRSKRQLFFSFFLYVAVIAVIYFCAKSALALYLFVRNYERINNNCRFN